MAELASGAVSSLLVVIRNETLLLSGVEDDVQFIKEEMESMKSFLAHLARSAPPGGEHNEQVRTWMNQVRLLAQDCNNCIDLYLYSGNPEIHRAKGRLRRYLWWVYWFLRKLVAQHQAAVQLRQLKDRARDVGQRRLRYGVEVPEKSAAGQSPEDDDEEEDGDEDHIIVKSQLVVPMTHHYGPRSFFEPPTLDDYVKAKLLGWAKEVPPGYGETLSIAIVASHTDRQLLALARETLVKPPAYHRAIFVNIPAVHPEFLPLGPMDVLYYILRELKHGKTRSQGIDQGEWEGKNLDSWQYFNKKLGIYFKKERELENITRSIEKMMISEKLDKIKNDIKDEIKSDIEARAAAHQQKGDQHQLPGLKKDVEELDLAVLLKLLLQSGAADTSQLDQVKSNRNMNKLLAWDDSNIKKIANKLKEHMEADEKTKEQMGIEEETAKQMGESGEGEERNNEKEEKEGGKAEQDGVGEDRKKTEEQDQEDEEEKEEGKAQQDGVGEDRKKTEEQDQEDEEKEGKAEQDGVGEDRKKTEEQDQEDKEEKEGGKAEQDGVGEDRNKTEEQDQEDEKQNEEEKGDKEERKEEQEQNKEEDDDDEDFLQKIEEEEEEEEEEEQENDKIHLRKAQYVQIIQDVFLKTTSSKPLQAQQQDSLVTKQATKTMMTTLDEEQIKLMIHEAQRELLIELQEGKHDKYGAIIEPGVPDQNQEDDFQEVEQKIEEIRNGLEEQMRIKGIIDKIEQNLGADCPLIILKVDEMMGGSRWEEIRKALSLLECHGTADALIFTTTESIQEAKGYCYCYKPREPIDYSLVGLYHDTVLELTSKQKNEANYNPQVFRNIFEQCEPHEFCMKIFTHALYANPKRSNEELTKLHNTLQASPKSFDIMDSLPPSPENNTLWRHACHITWLTTSPFSMISNSAAPIKFKNSSTIYLDHLEYPCSRC